MTNKKNHSPDYYVDDTGRYVFTRTFLLRRGFCCGNNCRHCPYDRKKGSQKVSMSDPSSS